MYNGIPVKHYQFPCGDTFPLPLVEDGFNKWDNYYTSWIKLLGTTRALIFQ
jgi:hypothetical protein